MRATASPTPQRNKMTVTLRKHALVPLVSVWAGIALECAEGSWIADELLRPGLGRTSVAGSGRWTSKTRL